MIGTLIRVDQPIVEEEVSMSTISGSYCHRIEIRDALNVIIVAGVIFAKARETECFVISLQKHPISYFQYSFSCVLVECS